MLDNAGVNEDEQWNGKSINLTNYKQGDFLDIGIDSCE